MNVLSLLPSQPSTSWASEAPDSVSNQSWYRQAYAPKDLKLLFDFIAKAAAHFKGSVAYWEFLNEPLWVPDFCLPRKGGYTIDTYIALLKGAAAAIRSANPGAKILGGLAIQPEIVFGDEFIKAGGLDYVDIFNLHPYPNKRVPETFIPNMERIRRLMDEYSVRKTIWATETSYWGVDEFPYLPWQPPADDWVKPVTTSSASRPSCSLTEWRKFSGMHPSPATSTMRAGTWGMFSSGRAAYRAKPMWLSRRWRMPWARRRYMAANGKCPERSRDVPLAMCTATPLPAVTIHCWSPGPPVRMGRRPGP